MRKHLLFVLKHPLREVKNGFNLENFTFLVNLVLIPKFGTFHQGSLSAGFNIAVPPLFAVFWEPDDCIIYRVFDFDHLVHRLFELRKFESDLYLSDAFILDISIEVGVFHDLLITVSIYVNVLDIILHSENEHVIRTYKCFVFEGRRRVLLV